MALEISVIAPLAHAEFHSPRNAVPDLGYCARVSVPYDSIGANFYAKYFGVGRLYGLDVTYKW
jgi:hypothetical protein